MVVVVVLGDDDDGGRLLFLLLVWDWVENGCVEGSMGFLFSRMALGDEAVWTLRADFVAALRALRGVKRKKRRKRMASCDDAGHGARRSCMSWRTSIQTNGKRQREGQS